MRMPVREFPVDLGGGSSPSLDPEQQLVVLGLVLLILIIGALYMKYDEGRPERERKRRIREEKQRIRDQIIAERNAHLIIKEVSRPKF